MNNLVGTLKIMAIVRMGNIVRLYIKQKEDQKSIIVKLSKNTLRFGLDKKYAVANLSFLDYSSNTKI